MSTQPGRSVLGVPTKPSPDPARLQLLARGQRTLEGDQHLQVREVARLMRIGVSTVWRWVKLGRLPSPVRFSKACLRWRASELLQYLNDLSRGCRDPTRAGAAERKSD